MGPLNATLRWVTNLCAVTEQTVIALGRNARQATHQEIANFDSIARVPVRASQRRAGLAPASLLIAGLDPIADVSVIAFTARPATTVIPTAKALSTLRNALALCIGAGGKEAPDLIRILTRAE